MKNVIDGLKRDHAVHEEFDVVKGTVTGLKKSGWLYELEDCDPHIQEAETRYCTAYDILERFAKRASDLHDILTTKVEQDGHAASHLIFKFSSLTLTTSTNGLRTFTALQAVIKVIISLREIQIAV